MDSTLKVLSEEWINFISYSPRIFAAFVIVLISCVVGKYLSKLVLIALQCTTLNQLHQKFFKVIAISIVVFFGFFIALNILNLERVAISMMAGGGLTAVVLGFAFREIEEYLLR